jgi:hypothetical protein
MEARSDGPFRDPKDIGDLGQGQSLVVVQDDDGSLIDRQAGERAIELVPVGGRGRAIRRGWLDGHDVK